VKSPEHVFVVDADIARAAGPDPIDHPWPEVAKACHDVLKAIWDCSGYRVAFDSTLASEWRRHQSNKARRWFADMLNARRLLKPNDDATQWVSDLIQQLPKHERTVAMKDCHLVALAHDPGDRRLLSNDRRARDKFRRIPDARVREIHWVEASTDSARWLLDGAPDRREWTLGYEGSEP